MDFIKCEKKVKNNKIILLDTKILFNNYSKYEN